MSNQSVQSIASSVSRRSESARKAALARWSKTTHAERVEHARRMGKQRAKGFTAESQSLARASVKVESLSAAGRKGAAAFAAKFESPAAAWEYLGKTWAAAKRQKGPNSLERPVGRELDRLAVHHYFELIVEGVRVDYVAPSYKVCIFCDGDAYHKPQQWHKRDCVARDAFVNHTLAAAGWVVVRLSEDAILSGAFKATLASVFPVNDLPF